MLPNWLEGNKNWESLERQAENAERVVDEKSEEAHEWRYARDMRKTRRISPSN